MADDTGPGPEVWYVRGEGGAIVPMSPPFGEGIADRLLRGHLTRVNADGTPYRAPDAEQADDGGSSLTSGTPPRPPQAATKAEWVGYAVRVHGVSPDDAEAMTKHELIEMYGRETPPSGS